ncbi:hypothetical protein R6Q59_027002 [Mikania micrantha]
MDAATQATVEAGVWVPGRKEDDEIVTTSREAGRGNLELRPNMQHRSVPSPGNGCSNTGNGGNRCVGSRKVAGRHEGSAPPPTLIQSTLVDH